MSQKYCSPGKLKQGKNKNEMLCEMLCEFELTGVNYCKNHIEGKNTQI
jgi:hypothetical protein